MENTKFKIAFVKKTFFEKHKDFIKMLDPNNLDKQGKRGYLFLKVVYEGNNLLVPLRSNIEPLKPYGVIGHRVSSKKRPNAGLDYRYILVINKMEYLEFPSEYTLPKGQQTILNNNLEKIEREVKAYVKGYVSAAVKGLVKNKPKYRESSLQNFNEELGVIEKKDRKERIKL